MLFAISFHFTPPIVKADSFSTNDLKTLATAYAAEYGIDADSFIGTIDNESQWDITNKGDYVKGKATSFGLCQFHYPERDWGMSIADANDPLYCMNTMAQAFKSGKQKKWSGYMKYMSQQKE